MSSKTNRNRNSNRNRATMARSASLVSVNINKPVDKITDFYELEDGCDRTFSRTEVRKMHVVPQSNSIIFVHRFTRESGKQMCSKIDHDFQ